MQVYLLVINSAKAVVFILLASSKEYQKMDNLS